jgi:N6-adenosine-specific RNA methylase IME4
VGAREQSQSNEVAGMTTAQARTRKLALHIGPAANNFGLSVPGELTPTSWQLPTKMDEDQWIVAGLCLQRIEGAVQWWLGDWWAYGKHAYGERKALFGEGGPLADMNLRTVEDYGYVANNVKTTERSVDLTWFHHRQVASLPPAKQREWLDRALDGDGNGKPWSSNQLKAGIARAAAFAKTKQIEFDAASLGKFAVLYADPPWRYENPPMGGSNRSIENQYPTMDLDEICALPVGEIAHDNAVLFMWATSPKLAECMQVLAAWDFNYRTDMVWVKDKIGMGYHVREKHESLLIAKRGELPPPAVEARPASVVEAPRLEHSAKPVIFYDIIDTMYPGIRKKELFGRAPDERPLWSAWGNQA